MQTKPPEPNPNRPPDPKGEAANQRNENHTMPKGIPIQAEGKLCMSLPSDLQVILSGEAFTQLFAYTYATNLEVSCLGSVVQERNAFRITRFHLLPQIGSVAHTELAPNAVAELIEKLIGEGKAADAHSIRAWAHSHPNMSLFWSQTDEETCRTLVSDYLISLVVGQGFSVRCRIDLRGPIPLTLDHVPVLYEAKIDEALIAACKEEVRTKLAPEPLLRMLSEYPLNGAPTGESEVRTRCDLCGGIHVNEVCPLEDEVLAGYAGWDEWERGGRSLFQPEPAKEMTHADRP